MKTDEKVLALLGSDLRTMFLKSLGKNLGISARLVFADPGDDGLRRARACNEMMIAIWSQVGATGKLADGYPDNVFLSVLIEKADAGNARSNLRNALEFAFKKFDEFLSGDQESQT